MSIRCLAIGILTGILASTSQVRAEEPPHPALETQTSLGAIPNAPPAAETPSDPARLISQSNTGTGEAASQTLGQAPEDTNSDIQFLRSDSVLLGPGEYQVEVSLQYLIDEADFALAQLTGGGLAIGEARQRRRLLLLPIELRIGVAEDLQAFVNVPCEAFPERPAGAPYGTIRRSDGGIGRILLYRAGRRLTRRDGISLHGERRFRVVRSVGFRDRCRQGFLSGAFRLAV